MASLALVLGFALQPGNILIWLLVGLIAGFVASLIMRGSGAGILGDIVFGLIGGFVGGLIAGLLFPGATFGFWGSLLFAIIGAIIVIAIWRAIHGGTTRRRRLL